MYAKLVWSGSAAPSVLIRDIIRLCTSNDPSTDLLGGYSTVSSVIIDPTPAGWEYVYSNSADAGTLAAKDAAATTGIQEWWAMKAPCLAPSGTYKFAVLSCGYAGNHTTGAFAIQGASNVVTTTITNRGFTFAPTSEGNSTTYSSTDGDMAFGGAGTYHLIATPRFFILYKEEAKMTAFFEHTATAVHEFYNFAPFIQYGITTNTTQSGYSGSAPTGGGTYTTTGGRTIIADLYNFTDPSTNTNYGVFTMNGPGNAGATTSAGILAYQPYLHPMKVTTTISATGATRNIVRPILFQAFSYGLPTCQVTGVSDVWMLRGGAGTTGDTITINGDVYTYFNVLNSSADHKKFGLAINTGQTE